MKKAFWRFYKYENAKLVVDSFPLGLSVVDSETGERYRNVIIFGLYWKKF